MKRLLFFALLLFLILPVNPSMGADSRAVGVIDFGRIDVPFKANFTITFTLAASKMYIKTDSPRILAPSQVTGNPGDTVTLNVSLVVPADAKPRDYVLHIYISTGLIGSVEAQVAYQIRFSVKGIDIAVFCPRPDGLFLAVYNSYPEEAFIRARIFMDGQLIRELQGSAPAKGYAVRNFTGVFEGRHNFTVVAYSNKGYETRYVYLGEVLPVDVKASVSLKPNGEGVEVVVTLENRGRDTTVVVEAKARSDKNNDSRSQAITLRSGDTVNVTFIMHISLPAFVFVRVISVTVLSWEFRVRSPSSQNSVTNLELIQKTLYFGPILVALRMILRVVRRPRGKFKTERVIAIGLSGPILALRFGEPLYPPGQALTILDVPQADFIGDSVVISERIYAIRSAENLKVYVVGYGDPMKGLELARRIRTILAKRGADIIGEIPPDDPLIEAVADIAFA